MTKVSIEEKSEIAREISISIPRSNYDQKLESQLNKISKTAKIKGFREGKAPVHIVKKMYGSHVQDEVLSDLIGKAYSEALDEHKLNVIGHPKIDITPIEDEKDLEVKALVELYPSPEIKDYKSLAFDCEVEELSKDAVDNELKRLAEAFATTEKVEGRSKVEDGDLLDLSFNGTINGEPFEGSNQENARIEVGRGSFPKEFEDALIGLELNKEAEVSVEMPKDIANPALAGKKAKYTVLVKEISLKKTPELNEEFIKENKISESQETLKSELEARLKSELEARNTQERETKYFEALFKKSSFEVPQAMIDEEIRHILFEARLLDPSDQKSYQLSVEGFRENLGEGALFRVRKRIALESIAKQESIEVDEEQVSKWLDEQAAESKVERKQVEEMYGYPGSLDRLKSYIGQQKTVELLLSQSKIKETKKKPDQQKA